MHTLTHTHISAQDYAKVLYAAKYYCLLAFNTDGSQLTIVYTIVHINVLFLQGKCYLVVYGGVFKEQRPFLSNVACLS